MHRREALEWLGLSVGGPALLAASPSSLQAVARAAHDRLTGKSQRERQVLDQHQDHTVLAIAEHIIPATDTPGAGEARVNEFIDLLLAEWFDDDERAQFLRGLANVDGRSLDLFGRVFVHAAPGEQVTLLRGLDAEVGALREAGGDVDGHIFATMKWLTLYGYYTSEIGQTRELNAVISPGRYDPCAPVSRDTPGEW